MVRSDDDFSASDVDSDVPLGDASHDQSLLGGSNNITTDSDGDTVNPQHQPVVSVSLDVSTLKFPIHCDFL